MHGSGRILLVGLIAVLIMGGAAPAWSLEALGLNVGLNTATIVGDSPPKVTYNYRPGLAAGLVVDFALTDDVRLSLQPMYVQKGANIGIKLPGDTAYRDSLSLQSDYVSLPILFRVLAGNGKTYVAGGIDIAYLLDATITGGQEDEDARDYLQDFDLSADFAFGAMLPIGKPRLTLEIRYTQSIINVAKPEELEGGTTLPVRFRNVGWQFLAGLLLPLGGR